MATDTGIPTEVTATFALRVRRNPMLEHSWVTSRHAVGLSVEDALKAEGIAIDDTTKVTFETIDVPPDARHRLRPSANRVVVAEPTPAGPVTAAVALTTFLAIPTIYAEAIIVASVLWSTRALLDRVFGISGGGQGSPLRDITIAGRNQAFPFDPVPVVLGKRRFTPPLAMEPHAELSGNNAYFNTMVAWGNAPVSVEDIQIGNDPLSAFNVTTQHDLDGKGTIKFAPREDERRLRTTLDSGWTEFQTQARAEYINVTVSGYPRATTSRSEESRSGTITDVTYHPYYRVVRLEYRKQGDTTWIDGGSATLGDTTTYTIYGRQGGSPRGVGRATISIDGGQDPNDATRRLPLEDAVYEVRATVGPIISRAPTGARTSNPSITVTRFNSRLLEAPVRTTGVALSAFRIFVPENSSASVDEINAIVGTKVPLFQESTGNWGADRSDPKQFGTSTNPADLFRAVLTSPDINARPLGSAFVDDDSLARWWQFCDAQGFTYSKVVTGGETRQDLLGEIAKAGRALPRMSGGKWGVSINDHILPTQVFTPRNSHDFRQQIDMPEFPHALRAQFDNERNDWQPDERVVYDDGFAEVADPANGIKQATHFETLNIPGVTDPDAVFKLARYVLATSRLRPRVISLRVGYATLAAELGDRVQLSHDAALIGQAYGRVKAVTGGVIYGNWQEQSFTPSRINFATFNPTQTTMVGLFTGDSTDKPLGWRHDGAFAVRTDGNTQYLIAAFGGKTGGKAVRSRTRASAQAAWSAWGNWSADTDFFEEDDADRVAAQSGEPVLFKLASAANGPKSRKLRSNISTHDGWSILTDSPAGRAADRQLIYQAYYGGRVWTRSVSGVGSEATITLDEPMTFQQGKTYALTVQQANGSIVTLPVSGDGTTYTVTASRASGVNVGDLAAFGESVLDCIISAIEPVGEGVATITLLPYAPEVFNAAETIPPYTTNVSRPVGPTFTGPPAPVIESIISNEDALPVDIKGVPTPTMLLRFSAGIGDPLNAKVTQPTQVRIRWRRTDDPQGDYQQAVVPIGSQLAYLAPVTARQEYEVELRTEDGQRGFSRWVSQRHTVVGLSARPSDVTTFEMEVGGNTTTLSWTHTDAPRDVVGYIIRWSPRPNVRQWDKMLDLVGNVSADDRSVTVPTVNGTYAIKAVDAVGSVSANALYEDSLVISPPEDVKVVATQTEQPTFGGTKTNVEVRNSTLQLERVTVAGDDPTLDDRADEDIRDWPYLFRASKTVVETSGDYQTAVIDLSGVFSVIATTDTVVDDPVNITNLMSSVERMVDLDTMSGVPDDGVTAVAVEVRSARTATGGNPNWTDWHNLSRQRISGRYFQFRVRLSTTDENVTPVVRTLKFTLSAKARQMTGSGVNSSASGSTTVTFPVAFEEDDIVVVITIDSPSAGDYAVVDSESAGKFTFSVRNSSGNRIAKSVSWIATGHGQSES